MVDEARVAALLHRMQEEVAALRRLAGRDDTDLFASEDALPAAKYRLVVAVEATVDTADHVIASEGLRPATSFADSFRSLREAGWLDDRRPPAVSHDDTSPPGRWPSDPAGLPAAGREPGAQ